MVKEQRKVKPSKATKVSRVMASTALLGMVGNATIANYPVETVFAQAAEQTAETIDIILNAHMRDTQTGAENAITQRTADDKATVSVYWTGLDSAVMTITSDDGSVTSEAVELTAEVSTLKHAVDQNSDNLYVLNVHPMNYYETDYENPVVTHEITQLTDKSVQIDIHSTDNDWVEYTVLPDGSIAYGSHIEYVVTENGSYTFSVFDASGNATYHTVEVTSIVVIAPEDDTTAPEIFVIYKTELTNGPLNIMVGGHDEESDVSHVIAPNGDILDLWLGFAQYSVTENGSYTFTLVNGAGIETTETAEITNITDAPIVEEEEDKVEDATAPDLYLGYEDKITNRGFNVSVSAFDTESDVAYIIMPNGNRSWNNITEYEITENGTYTFVAVNKAGLETSKTIVIENIDPDYIGDRIGTLTLNFDIDAGYTESNPYVLDIPEVGYPINMYMGYGGITMESHAGYAGFGTVVPLEGGEVRLAPDYGLGEDVYFLLTVVTSETPVEEEPEVDEPIVEPVIEEPVEEEPVDEPVVETPIEEEPEVETPVEETPIEEEPEEKTPVKEEVIVIGDKEVVLPPAEEKESEKEKVTSVDKPEELQETGLGAVSGFAKLMSGLSMGISGAYVFKNRKRK